jgi:hypothetical protein
MGKKYLTDRTSTISSGAVFWRFDTVSSIISNGSSSTENHNDTMVLLNKAAVQYPKYTDPLSMKTMSEPATNWTKVSNPLP